MGAVCQRPGQGGLRYADLVTGGLVAAFAGLALVFGVKATAAEVAEVRVTAAGKSVSNLVPNLASVPPRAWAVDAAANEVKVIQFGGAYVRYRIHQINARGEQVRDVFESRDGTVARLIGREGRALTPEEDVAERQRLQEMIDSPAAFQKHIRGDVNGKRMASEMVQLMPDAMLFTYAPGQPGSGRAMPHPPEVVLDFQPNPKWTAPNMTAEALTGLEGRLWIDSETRNVVRLDGTVFQPINFGFGMLAHIFPGGQVSLEQTNVGGGRWIFSHFVEHVTLRALMVKTVRENNEITGAGFQIVSAMSYVDAIRVLLRTPLPH